MITTTVMPELLHGVQQSERTERGLRPQRLPDWVRAQFPDPHLMMMQSQPSGVRLVMSTSARTVQLVLHSTHLAYRGADRPRGHVDLVVDGENAATDTLAGGDVFETDLQTGATEFRAGDAHTLVFTGLVEGEKRIELWLPHNESVELVELRTDAPIRAVPADRPVWLHYGSSISHGSNASTPTQIWPVVGRSPRRRRPSPSRVRRQRAGRPVPSPA